MTQLISSYLLPSLPGTSTVAQETHVLIQGSDFTELDVPEGEDVVIGLEVLDEVAEVVIILVELELLGEVLDVLDRDDVVTELEILEEEEEVVVPQPDIVEKDVAQADSSCLRPMTSQVEQEIVLVTQGSMLTELVVIGTLDDVDDEEVTPQPVTE